MSKQPNPCEHRKQRDTWYTYCEKLFELVTPRECEQCQYNDLPFDDVEEEDDE